jgi:uncharacterized repeat protein (TIGR01451 family)
VLSGQQYEFEANKDLSINETQIDGYEFQYITGDWQCPYYLGGTMNLNPGDEVSCIIVNNDIPNPAINVVKSGPSTSNPGEEVTYTFTVSNAGDVALQNINVEDSITGEGAYV